jgi:hypothetical protein
MKPLLCFALGIVIPISAAVARNTPIDAADRVRVATESAWLAATRARQDERHDITCRSLIGARAARALARYCIYQSTASRPPCSADDNHCVGLVAEIRRNLYYDRNSVTLPGARDMTRAHWRRVAQISVP